MGMNIDSLCQLGKIYSIKKRFTRGRVFSNNGYFSILSGVATVLGLLAKKRHQHLLLVFVAEHPSSTQPQQALYIIYFESIVNSRDYARRCNIQQQQQ